MNDFWFYSVLWTQFQKKPFADVLQNRCPKKFRNILNQKEIRTTVSVFLRILRSFLGYNKPKKTIFLAQQKFYIILIYSSSPRTIFKKPQWVFRGKKQKLNAIKPQSFSVVFLSFLQTIPFLENICSYAEGISCYRRN